MKDSYCVLDVFPEGGSEQERKKFKRDNPSNSEPVRLIFRNRSTFIDQRAIWTILVRTIRVAEFNPTIGSDIKKIIELGEGFGRSRNDLLYRNNSWLYQEDFQQPTCNIAINDDIHSYGSLTDFFDQQRDANFAFAAIFARVLLALINDIGAQGGGNIWTSSYVPCLTKFSGFSVAKLDALYASLYRRESFSVNI